MSDYFLGEIRVFAFDRIPKGWLACQGQLLPIAQNTALFSLLGTTYGGDGKVTFALPDLRGVAPLGTGQGFPLGMSAGETTHTLSTAEMPQHTHQASGSTQEASLASPAGNTWAAVGNAFATAYNVQMAAQAVSTAGGSQPHANMQPYLTLSLCISISGIYPSRP